MIEDYQAQTAALAAGTVTQVSAIYAAFQAGQITQAETAQLVASVINLANATAATLADAFISAQIEVQIGYPTPTVGVVPADDTARLELAAHTILDDLFTAVSEKTSAADDEIDDDQPDPVSAAEVRFERLARADWHFPYEPGSVKPRWKERLKNWSKRRLGLELEYQNYELVNLR